MSEFNYQLSEFPSLRNVQAYRDGDVAAAVASGDFWKHGYKYHDRPIEYFLNGDRPVTLFNIGEVSETLPNFLKEEKGLDVVIPRVSTGSSGSSFNLENIVGVNSLLDRWVTDYYYVNDECPVDLSARLPRTIWMYWNSGEVNAPRVVKASIKSWKSLNPGWDVVVLDDSHSVVRAASYLWEGKDMGVHHKSDLLRLYLMKTYGGVWADATTICTRPLTSWIDTTLKDNDFFCFRNDPVASWFMASMAGSPVATEWLRLSESYWEKRTRTDEYFWLKKEFKKILASPLVEGMSWKDASATSAKGPHILCRGADQKPGPEFLHYLGSDEVPLVKLSWKNKIAPRSKADLLVRLALGEY